MFNADSGHSDQQPSLDGPEIEEDGKDEGMPSLSYPKDPPDISPIVIITCDEQRIIDNVRTAAFTHERRPFPDTFEGTQGDPRRQPSGRLLPLRR